MKNRLLPLALASALLVNLPARADSPPEGAAATKDTPAQDGNPSDPAKLPFPITINAPADLAGLLREHLSIINRQAEPDADIDKEQMQFLAEETPNEVKQIVRSQGYFRAEIQE